MAAAVDNSWLLTVICIGVSLMCSSACQSATWLGDTPAARPSIDEWSDAIYIPNPSPSIRQRGLIYGWRYYSVTRNPISFMVFRPVGGIHAYRLISADSTVSNGNGLQYFGVKPIEVQAADKLGFYFSEGSVIPFSTIWPCYMQDEVTYFVDKPSKPQLVIGHTFEFQKMAFDWSPCRNYSFGALFDSVEITPKESVSLDENKGKEKIHEGPLKKMLSSLV